MKIEKTHDKQRRRAARQRMPNSVRIKRKAGLAGSKRQHDVQEVMHLRDAKRAELASVSRGK